MIPICREGGSIIAFGGRAMEADQQPKYLNSPETPIYTKGRTLYGLNVTKADIRQGRAASCWWRGISTSRRRRRRASTTVVATCGTALTQPQVQMLRRFTSKAVLSFDPDAAGQGAAVQSCDLLVREGFQVQVACFRRGRIPDVFVQATRVAPRIRRSWIRRARIWISCSIARRRSTISASPGGALEFLNAMLAVAAQIPSAPRRDQFADRLAHRAGVSRRRGPAGDSQGRGGAQARLPRAASAAGLERGRRQRNGICWRSWWRIPARLVAALTRARAGRPDGTGLRAGCSRRRATWPGVDPQAASSRRFSSV